MKKIHFAYDVLHREVIKSDGVCFTLTIRKYLFRSLRPLITCCIVKMPVFESLHDMPQNAEDYEKLCIVYEERIKSSLPLKDQIQKARSILCDRFFQDRLSFDED